MSPHYPQPSEQARARRTPERLPVVLVVEDHSDGSLLLGQLLRLIGYEPILAFNGLEALDQLDQLAQRLPDIILSDILMPEMDGLEMARVVRSTEAWSHIPMIAHTGLGSKTDLADILSAGFDQVLIKPVPLRTLESALRSATPAGLRV